MQLAVVLFRARKGTTRLPAAPVARPMVIARLLVRHRSMDGDVCSAGLCEMDAPTVAGTEDGRAELRAAGWDDVDELLQPATATATATRTIANAARTG